MVGRYSSYTYKNNYCKRKKGHFQGFRDIFNELL